MVKQLAVCEYLAYILDLTGIKRLYVFIPCCTLMQIIFIGTSEEALEWRRIDTKSLDNI